MKKILLAVLGVFMILSLTGCSSVNKIKKAFEKEEYVWKEVVINPVESSTEETVVIDGVYHVYKSLLSVSHGIIIEFNGDNANEVVDYIKENKIISDDTLNSIIKGFTKSPITNGNCMMISLSSEINEIFKNA